MSDYYIKIILLDGCPYGIAANDLLKTHNIKSIIINVNMLNKNEYKTKLISTFPQIYLCKNNSKGSQLLGGYDDLLYVISEFKGKKLTDDKIQQAIKKYNLSKKAILRFIQLINLDSQLTNLDSQLIN